MKIATTLHEHHDQMSLEVLRLIFLATDSGWQCFENSFRSFVCNGSLVSASKNSYVSACTSRRFKNKKREGYLRNVMQTDT